MTCVTKKVKAILRKYYPFNLSYIYWVLGDESILKAWKGQIQGSEAVSQKSHIWTGYWKRGKRKRKTITIGREEVKTSGLGMKWFCT